MRAYHIAGCVLVATALASPLRAAVAYKATLLHPSGYRTSSASAIIPGMIVGAGSAPFPSIGLAWPEAGGDTVDFTPPGHVASGLMGAGDGFQVGYASKPSTSVYGPRPQAMLWSGAPASAVPLGPPDYYQSFAVDVRGNSQVGYGNPSRFTPLHALLWHGTIDSVVDLHPAGFRQSFAMGVWGNKQIGTAYLDYGGETGRAMLWEGSASSAIDLTPTDFFRSYGEDVWNDKQVGYARRTEGGYHALLWQGSADNYIDLHPAGYYNSRANAIAGDYQAGDASDIYGASHAMVWRGSAASAIDLSASLAELGLPFTYSFANDVGENGVVVGQAVDADNRSYAIKWTPVPEPSSIVLLAYVTLALRATARREHEHGPLIRRAA